MYAKGMTTNDISAHIMDIYGLEVSDSTVSRVTDKILPVVREWQERPLENVYAVVFLDAIHYHVRYEGRIVKKTVYVAIGLDLDGKKDVLGMYVGENELPVLAVHSQQYEKQRAGGYPNRLCRRTDRLSGSGTGGISENGDSAMYHSPD